MILWNSITSRDECVLASKAELKGESSLEILLYERCDALQTIEKTFALRLYGKKPKEQIIGYIQVYKLRRFRLDFGSCLSR